MNFINLAEIFTKIGLKKDQIVADLGCGHGFASIAAAKKVGKDGKVYAVDIRKSALSAVSDAAKLDNLEEIIELVWADLEKRETVKIDKDSVDFSLLINVLFQSDSPEKMMTTAKNLTKKDGKILIIDWLTDKEHPLGPKGEQRVSSEKVKDIAKAIGLKLEDEFKAGGFHWGMVYGLSADKPQTDLSA